MRIFNKESDMTFTDWQNSDSYIYFNIPLTEYIQYSDMTHEQKKEHKYAETTSGCSITLEYKEAWAKWWEKNQDKKEKIKNLPNFNADIFEEITGIRIDAPEEMVEIDAPEEMVEIDGKKWSKAIIKEALKNHAN